MHFISVVPKELNTATFSKESLAVFIVSVCCVFYWPDTTWQYEFVEATNNFKMVTALVTVTGKKSCTKQSSLQFSTYRYWHMSANVSFQYSCKTCNSKEFIDLALRLKLRAEFGRMAGVGKRHITWNVGHECCAVGVMATERRYTRGDVSCIAELVGTAKTQRAVDCPWC
jgi:hypothetical protein